MQEEGTLNLVALRYVILDSNEVVAAISANNIICKAYDTWTG